MAPDAPPARRGFQFAIRVGAAVPFGQAVGDGGGTGMGELFGFQFAPLYLEIGAKIGPNLFVGAIGGGSIGSGGSLSACSDSGVSCSSSSTHLGAELQYHLRPAEKFDPWAGYGIGIERATFTAKGPGGEADIDLFGIEFGHLILGLDYRTKHVGVGPVLDLSAGEYLSGSATNGTKSSSGIDQKTLHGWFTFGLRFVPVWP